jgi:UDP-N-acetylmuramoylalanine--D-glutamate ligase
LSYLDGIEDCDKIVYTPHAVKNLEQKFGTKSSFWHKATTAQHLFFENSPTKNIIGVTGSKGKGTTSTLIAKMLEASGRKVFLGGNIGHVPLDFLSQLTPDSWVVLELANFQLYSLTYSPHIAVCLMITEEHLDWHEDMDEYVEAKGNLFRHQKPDDIAIYFIENEYSQTIAGYSPGHKIPYYKNPGAYVRGERTIVVGDDETEIITKSEVKLLGEHNLQNICAAVTAIWQVTQDVSAIKNVLATFSGLEHRLELIRELNNVKYYDDSFGTTPDTALVAIKAFPQPIVLILGGSDKGIPFSGLVDGVIKDRVKHVIAIGNTGPVIAEELREKGYKDITEGLSAMPEIVAKAQEIAEPGDVVLLSTGCASYGLFRDYMDRGEQFKKAVQALV